MTLFFGRRRTASNRTTVGRLNEEIVAALRSPTFYEVGGVADTFNGRFELLVLHLGLVVRRLRVLSEPGPAVAQDFIDLVFSYLDPAMRELGVGDLAVPKRMKKLAEAYLGRSVAYDSALRDPDPRRLAEALARNVYGGMRQADDLADYVRAAAARIEGLDLGALLKAPLGLPSPAAFLVLRAA